MLKIRLSRVGKRNNAQFRITVADARRAPSGKFIEILGHYNPHTKERIIKKDRVEYWISKGAKPSATVHNFLVDEGVLKGEKMTSWYSKKSEQEEENSANGATEKTESSAEKKEDSSNGESNEPKSE